MKSWQKALLAVAVSVTLSSSSCGPSADGKPGDGGGGGGGHHGPPPDLAGVWAGNWQGADPALGEVSGAWQATVDAVGSSNVGGSGFLTGDVDCMDGALQGSAGEKAYTGTVDRAPCRLNEWRLGALSSQDEMASGSWTQQATKAKGTFTGVRIARVGGPRITSVFPPSAAPGALVTIVGSGFDAAAGTTSVRFGDGSLLLPPLTASSSRLTVRVPDPAYTGPVVVTTPAGRALSPRAFIADVASPDAVASASVTTAATPRALAFSPDGRKLYVVNAGSVGLLSTHSNAAIVPTATYPSRIAAAPLGAAASANGHRVYFAAGAQGIVAADAALLQPVTSEAIPGFTTATDVAPGTAALALSPDGKRLYVADNLTGGVVRIVDLPTRTFQSSPAFGPTLVPACVAASPDGAHLLVGVRDASGTQPDHVLVLDATSGVVAGAAIPLGLQAAPVAIAHAPDGARAYVSSRGSGTVAAIDTANRSVVSTMSGFREPAGLALAPDGRTLLVAEEGADSVVFVDLATQQRQSLPIVVAGLVPTRPIAVAVSPEGRQAYVALAAGNTIVEVGASATLTVAVDGDGIGTVTSSPSGLQCGTACRARFASGTRVALTATPGYGSRFDGWGGNGCGSGSVTVARPGLTCTAKFANILESTGANAGAGCFVATAAYGSSMAPQVVALREFRDAHLLTNAPGRAFVQWYYAWSPAAAEVIRRDEALRALARGALWPAVIVATHPASSGTGIALLLAAIMAHRRRRAGR